MLEMKCNCARGEHRAPIKSVEISEHAIEKTAQILKEYKRIYMVADETTYEVAGRRVEKLLRDAGILSHVYILSDPAHATDANVGQILINATGLEAPDYDIFKFSENPDFILGVGSGSVNDACRMVSYRLGIEYGIVGTAPSMDGYISVVSPMIYRNRKIVYTCTVARHVIMDLSVISQAPYDMLLAGAGDTIGNYVAILDWELARDFNGEYYCQNCADMVLEATDRCIKSCVRLESRDLDTIRDTVEGLVLSGRCMAFTGTSRPASGTEHMIGQTREEMDMEDGIELRLHGIEVGEGTFAAQEIYRRMYERIDDARLHELIGKYMPKFDAVEKLQQVIKMPVRVTDRERFVHSIIRSRTYRVRYTALQYLYDRGLLDEYADAVYDPVMEKYTVK